MDIIVTYGVGEGMTDLVAFDNALFCAGIANYNLISMSSIIPLHCRVKMKKFKANNKDYGNKLYIVLSYHTVNQKNCEAWAGLGWMQDKKGKGIFVEEKGFSKKEVNERINATLIGMKSYRKVNFITEGRKLVGKKCNNFSVCASVCAIFKNESW